MTSERSQAYGRVMKMLGDMGASKLHAPEADRVRHAADTLLFADDADNGLDALGALEDMRDLAEMLVEADRWLFETADRLIKDVEACGPAPAQVESLVV